MKQSKKQLKYEIEKLSPMPGEIVLIKVTPDSLTGDEFRQLQRDTESLAQLLKRLVIIVPPNFDFSTMGETEMRRHGWQRIPLEPRLEITMPEITMPDMPDLAGKVFPGVVSPVWE